LFDLKKVKEWVLVFPLFFFAFLSRQPCRTIVHLQPAMPGVSPAALEQLSGFLPGRACGSPICLEESWPSGVFTEQLFIQDGCTAR